MASNHSINFFGFLATSILLIRVCKPLSLSGPPMLAPAMVNSNSSNLLSFLTHSQQLFTVSCLSRASLIQSLFRCLFLSRSCLRLQATSLSSLRRPGVRCPPLRTSSIVFKNCLSCKYFPTSESSSSPFACDCITSALWHCPTGGDVPRVAPESSRPLLVFSLICILSLWPCTTGRVVSGVAPESSRLCMVVSLFCNSSFWRCATGGVASGVAPEGSRLCLINS
mmetsp:Transcript_62919/g.180380  ORF Transcript_62919/g.180380 Transcript_62919/m.180380 type:complete len:224 (+) Transcript_62919:414-1085(+)